MRILAIVSRNLLNQLVPRIIGQHHTNRGRMGPPKDRSGQLCYSVGQQWPSPDAEVNFGFDLP